MSLLILFANLMIQEDSYSVKSSEAIIGPSLI